MPEATIVRAPVAQPAQKIKVADSQNWDWQRVLANTINDVDELASILELNNEYVRAMCAPNPFQLRVPLTFVARMQPGNLHDPLLQQVLPLTKEHDAIAGYSADPLQESEAGPCAGVIHKYTSRILLTVATSCPINCRYCFRRHYPYAQNRLTPSTWQPALDYINSDSNIREVILSGGEPLMLKDSMLDRLLFEIEAIAHVKLIRIHSRFPIVVPQRITRNLYERLAQSRCNVTLVLHSNHPNEIDAEVKHYLQPLTSTGVTVLNQSVLLRGINDCSDTLAELAYTLFDAGVLPYYLHALDPVTGTAHFAISDARAKQIAAQLINTLPGYLVPTLVRELPGRAAKTRLFAG